MAGFSAHIPALAEHFQALATLDPRNPFHTPEYAAAHARMGAVPCALLYHDDAGQLTGGCIGLLRGGKVSRSLEIVSAPSLPHAFWDGVAQFCRRERVWDLQVESFGSAPLEIPDVGVVLSRRQRTEYVLDLVDSDARTSYSTNLRRNLQRAERSNLRVGRSRDPAQIESHVRLMDASSQRRAKRGEYVPESTADRFMAAAIASGCAEVFYATCDQEVVSSLLVLRAARGAYYHSAGTSPSGMKVGASTLVVSQAMRMLHGEGVEVFNLGGADETSDGLRRFKTGFGSRAVELNSAFFSMVPAFLRKLRSFGRDLRDDPGAALNSLCAVEHYIVYRASPEAIAPTELTDPPREFRRLSDTELVGLAECADFADQAHRFRALRYNTAYGLFEGNELVHVAWLITPDLDARTPIRNVRLKAGEAEITHCETRASHRGRGLYPIAIAQLCRLAAHPGVKTVYMITASSNESSQRGIERAGFRRCGTLIRLIFPLLPRAPWITWRGHRWGI
jgi:hypothetical protein